MTPADASDSSAVIDVSALPPLPPTEGYCVACGDHFDKRRYDPRGVAVGVSHELKTCPRHRWARRRTRVDRVTAFVKDQAARRFVDEHPDGATLEEVAAALGVSRERVRQIESRALRKLRAEFPPELLAELLGVARHDGLDGEAADRGDDE